MKKIVVATILLFGLNTATASFQPDTAAIMRDIRSADIQTKVHGLNCYALYLFMIRDDGPGADSVAQLALLESRASELESSFFESVLVYQRVALHGNAQKVRANLQYALNNAERDKNEDRRFRLHLHFVNYFTSKSEFSSANEHLQAAMRYIIEDPEKRLMYFICLGDFQMKAGEKIAAFQNYNDAILLSKKLELDSMLYESYDRMYQFYSILNDRGKAREFITKMQELISGNAKFTLFDSLLLKARLIDTYIGMNESDLAIKLVDEVLPRSSQHGFYYIDNYIFGSLRSYYLSNDKQQEICDLYCTKYPSELLRLSTKDPRTYYRVQALIYEKNGLPDSARYSLRLAEELTLQLNNPASVANFYKRKGQFNLRQHDMPAATSDLERYFSFAIQSRHFPFIIDAAGLLDSVYSIQGNVKEAYRYAKLRAAYADTNAGLVQKDKLLGIEIQNLEKLRSLEREKEVLQQTKVSNFQVLMIFAILLFSIMLLVLISRFKISRPVLKVFGYVTFVLLFEFIIYGFDSIIHRWAHGQPLKIIAVKVLLISFLLPVHHATEFRVLKFLTRKNRVKEHSPGIGRRLLSIWQAFRNWLNIDKDSERGEPPENEAREAVVKVPPSKP